ncbi:DNA excision repair protein ERCC-6-like 2 isoform X2 [Hyperolius riggenbachi]|uniref:DNA excision repair protein ERCC-6-like 2 isoform X2 n=1 Tax=Hyperolius riggenbachi TaxID=752182 RepID=UPI0035A26BFB
MDKRGLWCIEEKCRAPYSDNGELKEAVVKSIHYKENNLSYAVVSFLDATKRKIPLSLLRKEHSPGNSWNASMFDDEDLEKPSFPGRKPEAPATSFPLSNTGICVPYTINRYLRDYQRDGVRFLYEHYSRTSGCILGDDMGLGKTIQVIAFLAAVLHKKGTREDIENNMPEFLQRTMKKKYSTESAKMVFLIVSPLSVLFNWKDELETWGYFRVTVIHGSKRDYELARLKQGKYEIALTTYETLRLCLDDLNSIDWSAVIVDEVHKIKNPKARVTQVMKLLKCNVRIGLTGTILQNNMEELWCVMDWAVPAYFGSKNQFKEEFSNPVELGQRHNATKRELATGRKVMQKLAAKMSSFFLRRTKALISNQLPKKDDRIVYCALSEFQKAVYQTVLETQDVSLVLQGGEKCSCNSGRKRRRCCFMKNQYDESVKTLYFSYLAILRKVANHAALLQSTANTSKKQEDHIRRICSEVFSKFPEFVKQTKEAAFQTISDPKYSGKMKVLQQLLNHCRKNKDKVLLFSFSTKLLDILERYCMASGLEYRRLDGTTKAEERLKTVKEFNSAEDVNLCLVSTMAGGLGLNFVGANVVVVFDPTWNPANDLQAIDRAYRIGQCRDVKVFRLISLGTVEEIIYLRQVYKQQLHCAAVGSENAKRYFKAVQGSKEHKGELFGINNLFKLRTQGTCLTKDILEREGQVEAGIRSTTMFLNQQSVPSDANSDESMEDAEMTVKSSHQFQKETFDFSSDSDNESGNDSRRKGNASTSADRGKQLTLQQCGFSKLLEQALDQSKTNDLSGSSSGSSRLSKIESPCKSEEVVEVNISNNSGWNISFDSDGDGDLKVENKRHISGDVQAVLETESSSDESDNIVLPTQANKTSSRVKSATGARAGMYADTSSGSDLDCTDAKRKPKYVMDYGSDYISDESDDITIPAKPGCSKASKHYTEKSSQTIDGFSSSEDDEDKREGHVDNQEQKCKSMIHKDYSHSKSTSSKGRFKLCVPKKCSRMDQDDGATDTVKENIASLDRILDGVTGVAYIHSNQNVIGSSKAENHLSHWAVRDVFEFKQFSQLPANIAPDILEKSNFIKEERLPQKDQEGVGEGTSTLQHQVVHKKSEVLKVGEKMFLVGKTPRAIMKRHFEQMVSYFKMDTAEQLAHHILGVQSHIRQSMLQDFYASQHAEVKTLYPVQVPQPEEKKRIVCKITDSEIRIKKRRKKADSSEKTLEEPDHFRKSHSEILQNNLKHHKKNDMSSVRENVNKHHSPAQERECRDYMMTEPHACMPSDHTSKVAQKESSKDKIVRNAPNTVGDLLGDTSILDDLFSNSTNRRSAPLPVRSPCDLSTAKPDRRAKDFWDILSDQSDESINRLTDLSVIEKVCETSVLPSVAKKDDWNDSLWVSNKKFLWKKNKTDHTDSPSPALP